MMVAKWMEQCIVIKGTVRTAIYDLNRYDVYFADLNILDLIAKIEGLEKNKIYEALEPIEIEWYEYLTELELINFVPISCFENFAPISISWEIPNFIYEASIHEYNDLEKSLFLLENLNCRHLTLIMENEDSIESILANNFTNTNLFSLNLLIKEVTKSKTFYKKLKKKFPVLNDIISPSGKVSTPIIHHVGLTSFMESFEHNVHFNRKIHIDEMGRISNTPRSKKSDLNINDLDGTEIKDQIINDLNITKYWTASKNETDICKVCEIRHQCIDKRTPEHRESDNQWFHITECDYNPFIAKWKGEEGYLSLKEINVTSNIYGFKINSEKVENHKE
ncbi:MAG: hypothetical protein ACI8ZM_004733 [Crocinitomix sp.]|jgi:hypothetical protein